MTNEGIVLIMRCINEQPLYWEDIRRRSDWYELWKFLINSPNFIPSYPQIVDGVLDHNAHWTYVPDKHLLITGAA